MEHTKEVEIVRELTQEDYVLKIQELAFKAHEGLVGFLMAEIRQAKEKNDLKVEVVEEILRRVRFEKAEITFGSLVRALEVITKSENDKNASLLGLLKQNHVTQEHIVKTFPGGGSSGEIEKKEPFSKEEFEAAKKVLEFMDSIKESK